MTDRTISIRFWLGDEVWRYEPLFVEPSGPHRIVMILPAITENTENAIDAVHDWQYVVEGSGEMIWAKNLYHSRSDALSAQESFIKHKKEKVLKQLGITEDQLSELSKGTA